MIVTFISMLPKSKSFVNKSSTVGLYLVSNFLNKNLFKIAVLLCFLAARNERNEFADQSFQVHGFWGQRRREIRSGWKRNTHPVPWEPSRTSRKWNFSTSAIIVSVEVVLSCLLGSLKGASVWLWSVRRRIWMRVGGEHERDQIPSATHLVFSLLFSRAKWEL